MLRLGVVIEAFDAAAPVPVLLAVVVTLRQYCNIWNILDVASVVPEDPPPDPDPR